MAHRKDAKGIAASRLPDLPIAGYATQREKELTDEMMLFIRSAERDRLYLLSMVCDGLEKFRGITKKAWRHLQADDAIVDAVFGYLVLLAGDYPHLQRDEMLRIGQMSQVNRIRHVTGMDVH